VWSGRVYGALAKAVQEFCGSLKSNGGAAPFCARLFDFSSLNRLIGTQWMLARGKQYEAGFGAQDQQSRERSAEPPHVPSHVNLLQ
jgi:hypothetical protein